MQELFSIIPKGTSLPEGPVHVLGIDLGTTNSTVAEITWTPGARGLPQARCMEVDQKTLEGTYTHVLVPSVVAICEGKLIIGEGAKRLRARCAEFGLELYRSIFWECKNHMGIQRTYQKAPVGFRSAKEVAGHVLSFLAASAKSGDGGRAARTVITVPASFQAAQRRDTQEAASLAGLDLAGGDLLDEPLAAFLDYVFTHGFEVLGSPGESKNLLVFDFGGGTCDVAVFRLRMPTVGEALQVAPLAVSRYHRLGGGDIDLAVLFEVLLPQLIEQNNLSPFDLSYEDKVHYVAPAFLGIAEALKVGLCREIARLKRFGRYDEADRNEIVKKLPGSNTCTLKSGRELRLHSPVLSASQFEGLLETFLDQDLLYARDTDYRMTCSIFAPLQDGLGWAGLSPEVIDYCLMVGGSSLIPQVCEAVSAFLPQARLLHFSDAEATQTAVARGAAYQALILALCGCGLIRPVAADSISIQTRLGPVELVPRGHELPYPSDGGWAENQHLAVPRTSLGELVSLKVDLLGSDNALLGRGTWKILPPVNKGERLCLRYRLDENQVLHLKLHLAEDEARGCFDLILENPLTNVVNPNTKREEISELEEKVRTKQVPRDQIPETVERVAALYADLGQRERALDLLRRVLQAKGGADAGILNRMGILCGEIGDDERQEKLYLEAAAASLWSGPLFNLALAQKRRGKAAEALTTIDKAISRDREAPYLVLRALLVESAQERETCLNEAFALFEPVHAMSDWDLGWFATGARLAGNSSKLGEAEAELRRRRRGTRIEDHEGDYPDTPLELMRMG